MQQGLKQMKIHNVSMLCKTHRTVSVSICLCSLSADFESPMMTQTTTTSCFLPFLQIFSEFGSQLMRVQVQWLTSLHILPSIQEPVRNVILTRILNDCLHFFNLFLR